MIYESINQAVLQRIPAQALTLLDVGCGAGALGAAVKRQQPCSVVGLTFSPAEAQQASQRLDRVELADLNQFEPAALGRFDCIVCSHVLEHLMQPSQVLTHLRACLEPNGTLLVALPNALFWKQRLEFLRGRFRYTEGGLMDSTHYRFFDLDSAEQMIRSAGFTIEERCADGSFPLAQRLGHTLGRRIDAAALARFPGLFGFQFVWRCKASGHPLHAGEPGARHQSPPKLAWAASAAAGPG
jgi:SAM-dependent methyltransferase